MSLTKTQRRNRIKHRVRKKIFGTAERPRLSVYRSNKGIMCQLIDDVKGVTLASASTREKTWKPEGTKSEQAHEIGKLLAERAIEKNITTVVFDRNGDRKSTRLNSSHVAISYAV